MRISLKYGLSRLINYRYKLKIINRTKVLRRQNSTQKIKSNEDEKNIMKVILSRFISQLSCHCRFIVYCLLIRIVDHRN